MYIDNLNFVEWMEKLSSKLDLIGKDIKTFITTSDVLEDNEKILDNQELCFLLKVSNRTLQRYRDEGKLPYFRVKAKIYYRASEIRVFIKEHASVNKVNLFEKVTAEEKLSPFSP